MQTKVTSVQISINSEKEITDLYYALDDFFNEPDTRQERIVEFKELFQLHQQLNKFIANDQQKF